MKSNPALHTHAHMHTCPPEHTPDIMAGGGGAGIPANNCQRGVCEAEAQLQWGPGSHRWQVWNLPGGKPWAVSTVNPRGWPCGLQLFQTTGRATQAHCVRVTPPSALDDGHGAAGLSDWLWSSLLSSGPRFGSMTSALAHCVELFGYEFSLSLRGAYGQGLSGKAGTVQTADPLEMCKSHLHVRWMGAWGSWQRSDNLDPQYPRSLVEGLVVEAAIDRGRAFKG